MSAKTQKNKNGKNPLKLKVKRLAYTEDQMNSALKAVEENIMSKAEAARIFNVPKTTLFDKSVGKSPRERKMGHPPYITSEEEEEMVKLVSLFYLEAEWYFRVDILNFQQFKLKFDIQNFEF